ncbi:hypothetical protein ETAA8_55500 [Anatilimnocola aggregata]|uniref:Uncharacterized protein n=1 Tax=Anatilimnocola aggregata TaxID=2528021 RepID=A0A517YJL5_9BACT|nr:hypothetical protein [Anatilimnocola aggregata]QDU30410.1 hypothetical protein ETAA8_55500 [Anatilimnocola aggregata]
MRQFSLQTLLILIALVGLFFALRQSLVIESPNPIGRAHLLPPLLTAIAVAIGLKRSSAASFVSFAVLGACVSTVVAAALAIEIAEELRRMKYWNWASDFSIFCRIVAIHAIVGGVIGLVFVGLFKMFGTWRSQVR